MNLALIVGISWIAFVTGMAVNSVGTELPASTPDWTLPLTVSASFGATFLCGYLAGKDKR